MKRFLPSLRRLFGPKLNCWPGAVCRIVNDGSASGHFLGGRFITVTSLTKNLDGEAAWFYEGRQFLIVLGFDLIEVAWIPDAILRPITPRGDEVSDAEVKALFKSDTAPMVKESA